MESFDSPTKNLTDLQSQFSDILRWAGVARWEFVVADGVFDIHDAFLTTYGYQPEDFQPLTLDRWKQLLHPDDFAHAVLSFERVVAGHVDTLDAVYRMRTASGEWRSFRSKGGFTEVAPDKKVLRLAGILQDVTNILLADSALQRRDRLLSVVNDIASILLATDPDGFTHAIAHVLAMLGSEAEVDRVYIWKNEHIDGEQFSTQVYEWSPHVESQQGNANTIRIKVPLVWEKSLNNGKCVIGIVKNMSQEDQEQLLPQGVVSILVAPIMFQGVLWGFIGFDDCHHERTWTATEISMLKSVGIMVASAIQRHQTLHDLNRERRILDRIISTSPVTTFTITGGVVSNINEKGKMLFDVQEGTPTEIVYAGILGKHKDAFHRDSILEEMQTKGIFLRHDVQFSCRDGKIRDFIVASIPFVTEDVQKAITWIIDVTELKEAERALTLAKEKAESATHAKSDFLARMSHEIRTPMNAILGMIYLCLQTTLTAQQADYLTKTQSAANNLLGIINDILDFSKIEAGKFELELISFSLSKTIREVIDVVNINAKSKGLKLITKIDPDVCDSLIGDSLRLRQILLNLISNALKFTTSGGVFVTVKNDESWYPDDPEKIRLVFEVKDTGIGLKADQIGTIFDSFAQADGSTTRKYGGTGLGLAIVKSLVNLMKGEVSVISTPGQGAAFTFTAVFITTQAEPEMSSAILLSKRRVLIIDDNANDLEILTNLLQSMRINTSSARSGQAALEFLEEASEQGNPFELALVDWRMPRMDGIETVRRIRNNHKITPLRILMTSAYDRSECFRHTQGLDVADVLVKPILPSQLKDTLKSIFQESISGKINEVRADLRGAKILLAEDNKINQLVASELLTMMQVELTVASNGIEAVEAVKKEDFDLILMDIQMPEMDGLTATQIIRHLDKPGLDKVPILAMTANAMDTDYQKSLEVGMNDHLTKPIEPDRLRLALEKWIVR